MEIVVFLLMLSFMAIPFLISPFISWLTHKDMTRGKCDTCKKSDFKTFKRLFIDCDMRPMKHFKGSWENESNDSEYHASIFKFKGKGLIMKNPIEYLKVIFFMRTLRKHIENGNEIEWYDN